MPLSRDATSSSDGFGASTLRGSVATESAMGWPRLAIFLLSLPDPVPMPHGATFTRMLGGTIAEWAGLPGRLTEDGPKVPEDWNGQHFVSLKLWQVKEPSLADDRLAMDAMFKVASSILGHRPMAKANPRAADSYRTVVEMVVTVADPSLPAEDGFDSDPLTRGLNFLMEIFRGYRAAHRVLVPELTYQRLPSFALQYWRDPLADGSGIIDGPIMVFLDHFNVRNRPAPDFLDADGIGLIHTVLGRLLKGDPLLIYRERMIEAHLALKRDGDLANAVIQISMSAEVLLDRVLSLMIWEETLGRPDFTAAAQSLGLDLKPKLRTQYHTRLGGQWDLAKGVLAEWDIKVARLRGRVVHGGYRPTPAETAEAFAAAEKLEAFIVNRLVANLSIYKRTALLILGKPGLHDRSAWPRVKDFAEKQADTEPDWIKEFVAWRAIVDQHITKF